MVFVQHLLLGRDVTHVEDKGPAPVRFRVLSAVFDEKTGRFMVCVASQEDGGIHTWPASDARILWEQHERERFGGGGRKA